MKYVVICLMCFSAINGCSQERAPASQLASIADHEGETGATALADGLSGSLAKKLAFIITRTSATAELFSGSANDVHAAVNAAITEDANDDEIEKARLMLGDLADWRAQAHSYSREMAALQRTVNEAGLDYDRSAFASAIAYVNDVQAAIDADYNLLTEKMRRHAQ